MISFEPFFRSSAEGIRKYDKVTMSDYFPALCQISWLRVSTFLSSDFNLGPSHETLRLRGKARESTTFQTAL